MAALRFVLMIGLLSLPAAAVAGEGESGLPLPRFVSLKNSETNVRTGPGTRYPIQWVYQREELPVEVIEEFELWRKVRDADGSSGWVHRAMLSGARHALISGKEARVIRIDADAKAKPILKAEPSVIVSLIECAPEWCRIQISGRKGWIEKRYLWGVYKEEVFD